MRVLILADLPVHALPGFEDHTPSHSATWFVPLIKAWNLPPDLDLHWVTLSKRVRAAQTLTYCGQTFHLLPRGKLSIEMLTGFRRERVAIRRLTKELKPDLIHAWGTETGYAMAALDAPMPKLLSMQGILSQYCEVAKMPFLTRVQARTERRDLPRFNDITVESPWGIEQVRRRAPDARLHHIEYGVDPALIEIERNPAGNPVALFVGTLNSLKGVDTLLTAFQHPSLSHIELRLLGDGPLRDSVSAPNITFLGYRSHDEVISEMCQAWCLVHPTLADTSPNCVKEARVLGLPVVTTPNGGQTQYVAHRRNGWIHQAGDIEQLIEGVRFLTTDRQSSISIGENGKSDCRTALSAATCADHFTSLYRQITAR